MADAETFDAFYRRSRDRLAVQLAALTGEPGEAADHVQEAFARAWARWDRVGGYDDPEGWVRRVAYRIAVSRWRRARRFVPRAEPIDTTVELALDADQLGLLDALRTLPPRERQAVVLHHLADRSVEQTAAEMGCPAGTVKSLLHRGRAHLATALDDTIQEVTDGHR